MSDNERPKGRQTRACGVIQRAADYSRVVADLCGHRESPSASEVYAFIDNYKPDRQAELPPSLPLPISKKVICFHKKIIRYFAKDFGSSMLAVHPMSMDSIPCPSPLSSSEIRRIHRALYRFELYYRLFAGSQWAVSEWMGLPAPTIKFLSLYPPWEVEEMHCIHDFLYRRFLVAYIDVAQHDVRMGNSGMHSGPLKGKLLLRSLMTVPLRPTNYHSSAFWAFR